MGSSKREKVWLCWLGYPDIPLLGAILLSGLKGGDNALLGKRVTDKVMLIP